MPAPDRPDTYTLDELTSAADVTVRTVRYYIAEGLLPPPDGSGRAARYSGEHRDRLAVINSLKQRHLPLREIRRYLQDLTDDDIADLASEVRTEAGTREAHMPYRPSGEVYSLQESAYAAEPTIHASGDSRALDYIRSIRENPPHRRPVVPMPHVPAPHTESDRQWHRLSISPDAELLVSNDLYHRRREQIESLLAWARRVINEP